MLSGVHRHAFNFRVNSIVAGLHYMANPHAIGRGLKGQFELVWGYERV